MMRNEMRNEPHQLWMVGTLPRSMRRYEKRRQRQYFARLAMREYSQEHAAEQADFSAYLLDMDYADAYSNEDEWQEYATEADRREAKQESEYDPYLDWDDDYEPIQRIYTLDDDCTCAMCRPDLYPELRGYLPGARGRIVNMKDGVSLGELLRKRLQP